MKLSNFFDNIEKLIEQDELLQALNKLKAFNEAIENTTEVDSCILVISQLNNLSRQTLRGTIAISDIAVQVGKVRQAALKLLSIAKKTSFDSDVIVIVEKNEHDLQITKKKTNRLLILIPIVTAILFFGIGYFLNKPNNTAPVQFDKQKWVGNWTQLATNIEKCTLVRGKMKIEINGEQFVAYYDNKQCTSVPTEGKIEGKLDSEGRTAKGTWKNTTSGISGVFMFEINEQGTGFTGYYTKGESAIQIPWFGLRE